MRRLNPRWVCLGVCWSLIGLLCLHGCTSSVEQATEEEVTNRAFAFTDGAVFHAALAGQPTTLVFTNNAATFMLLSADGSKSATGRNRFGSCILTVTSSTYEPGAGPQVSDVMTLNPCDFNSDDNTLKITRGSITFTSEPAVARVVEATASDVRNRSFFFANGGVFNPGLASVATTLAFNSDATEFTLNSTNGSASGSARFSPCVLTVTSSTHRSGNGPLQGAVITLRPCRFNGGNRSLLLSNDDDTIAAQST